MSEAVSIVLILVVLLVLVGAIIAVVVVYRRERDNDGKNSQIGNGGNNNTPVEPNPVTQSTFSIKVSTTDNYVTLVTNPNTALTGSFASTEAVSSSKICKQYGWKVGTITTASKVTIDNALISVTNPNIILQVTSGVTLGTFPNLIAIQPIQAIDYTNANVSSSISAANASWSYDSSAKSWCIKSIPGDCMSLGGNSLQSFGLQNLIVIRGKTDATEFNNVSQVTTPCLK